MSDKIFIDTNIFVYAKLETAQDPLKQQQAKLFLKAQQNPIAEIAEDCIVSPVSFTTIQKAWEIKIRYQFSYWDSLIIAAALENDCGVLITEDLQHNQIIAEKLQIKNPFQDL